MDYPGKVWKVMALQSYVISEMICAPQDGQAARLWNTGPPLCILLNLNDSFCFVGEGKHSTEFFNHSENSEVKKAAIKPQNFFPLLGYQILQLNCEEKLLFTGKKFARTWRETE